MSNNAITIKRIGTANNVMYNNVLIGCFEDGDTEMLMTIMAKSLDTYSEKLKNEMVDLMLEGCNKAVDISWDMYRKGQSKSTVQKFINMTFRLAQ